MESLRQRNPEFKVSQRYLVRKQMGPYLTVSSVTQCPKEASFLLSCGQLSRPRATSGFLTTEPLCSRSWLSPGAQGSSGGGAVLTGFFPSESRDVNYHLQRSLYLGVTLNFLLNCATQLRRNHEVPRPVTLQTSLHSARTTRGKAGGWPLSSWQYHIRSYQHHSVGSPESVCASRMF